MKVNVHRAMLGCALPLVLSACAAQLIVPPPGFGELPQGIDLFLSARKIYQFPVTSVGNTSTVEVTLNNDLDQDVTIIGVETFSGSETISFSGGQYPGMNGTCGASLTRNASCKLHLEFTPSQAGQNCSLIPLRFKRSSAASDLTNLPVCGAGSLHSGTYISDFGTGGTVTHTIGGGGSLASAARQADGKLVVSGYDSGNAVLMRFDDTGAFDSSFGSSGVATVAASPFGLEGLAIQNDGKFLGYTYVSGSPQTLNICRATATGAVDTSFNGSGCINLAPANYAFGVGGVSLYARPDGAIFVVTSAQHTSTFNLVMVVAKINSNGTLDAGFAGTGLYTGIPDGSFYSSPGAGFLRPDGKLLVSNSTLVFTAQSQMCLFGNSGLDTSFAGTGYRNFPLLRTLASEAIKRITPSTGGKLFLSGISAGSGTALTTYRSDLDAVPDSNFKSGSAAIFFPFGSVSPALSVLATADGTVTSAASAPNLLIGQDAPFIYRLDAQGELDSRFGPDLSGKVVRDAGLSLVLNSFLLDGPPGSGTFYWIDWGTSISGLRLSISKLWQ